MTTRSCRNQILTIPNLLSVLRLALIPVFVLLYQNGQTTASAVLLALSGLTDLMDGWYARRFNSVTDVGKVLDPVADKLTQLAMLLLLALDTRALVIPLVLLVVKEAANSIGGLMRIQQTGVIPSAAWHGKAATAFLYLTMFVHALWQDIPQLASNILMIGCIILMLLSMSLYLYDNMRRVIGGGGGS